MESILGILGAGIGLTLSFLLYIALSLGILRVIDGLYPQKKH